MGIPRFVAKPKILSILSIRATRPTHATRSILFIHSILSILLFWSTYSQGNDQLHVVSQIKASYIYNFINFVVFSEKDLSDDQAIHTCILGEDSFGTTLNKIDGLTVPQGTIKVFRLGQFRQTTDLSHCHVVYVTDSEAAKASSILEHIDPARTFTIADFSEFIAKGGLIELYETDDSIRFKINRELATSSEFKVSAQLISLGLSE